MGIWVGEKCLAGVELRMLVWKMNCCTSSAKLVEWGTEVYGKEQAGMALPQ